MDFLSSLFSGKLGESLQLFMLAKHVPEMKSISLPTSDGVNSRDATIGITNISGQINIDMKTDFYALKTKNCVMEIVSQFKQKHLNGKPKHLEGIFLNKTDCIREILDQIMFQIVSGKKLSRFSYNEQGWLIKDGEPNRYLTIFPTPFTRVDLNSKASVIKEYLKKLYCIDQDIGENQVQAMRDNHDEFMQDLKIKQYKFYLIKKQGMLNFLKDTYNSSNYRVCATPNSSYHTLNYLVPFNKFCKNDWCSEYVWKSE